MTTTTVFISGANGYLAQHIIKQLLVKGYKVIGSVRSHAKGEQLTNSVKDENFSYIVIPIITHKHAFYEVLLKHPEITVFLHTASPVTFEVEDNENDLLRPAIDGTISALKAIKRYAPQMERVVITSSAGAIFGFNEYFDSDTVYNEDSWSPLSYEQSKNTSAINGYFGSKKYAELAAWEFMKEQTPSFDITVVAPVYCFGPQAYGIKDKSKLNLSMQMVNTVLTLTEDDDIPEFGNIFADIRDVARAHIVAFESDEARGQRLLVATENFTFDKIANIISNHFVNVEIPPGNLSKNERIYKLMVPRYDNSKTNRILGFDFIGIERSILDTADQLLG
ncbi:uncharacterized protein SPAPADRAFT_152113 [Spathaspora passalidarum NRRL Y-27907]|uniref:NAD-dependent epimerase/dehydratase domain-containing protein n=1 Tax=Spathaspora passalidarum (strain NRRL Y-27907 / 11-Y1) TaxID=619300 RepID=G3AN70_SPAPN|nr:uncharacterized protein SPAPADRAFT_152113 [Spathaspora passalidarum NRRL Y-27907]EGW31912.1 hypothetical protein SPAPADRAFT_152113 [Spathaspora passalidarum NRRL Y-27907]